MNNTFFTGHQHITTLLLQNRNLKLEIHGHTDNVGEAKYNLSLSEKRANTFFQYLQLFDIIPERLLAKGYSDQAGFL
mgnify:CR=1 FL=1